MPITVTLRDYVQVNLDEQTVRRELPAFWPQLGLMSTLAQDPNDPAVLRAKPLSNALVPLPVAVKVVASGQQAANIGFETEPMEADIDLPGPGFLRRKLEGEIRDRINSVFKRVLVACKVNFERYMTEKTTGVEQTGEVLAGRRIEFSNSSSPATIHHAYDIVKSHLPTFWEQMGLASTLEATGDGRWKIVPSRFTPVPVNGLVHIERDGNFTKVRFTASANLPLDDVPGVLRNRVEREMQKGFGDGLAFAIQKGEAYITEQLRQKPVVDGLA